jgi:hypothetical protein
VVLLDNHDQVFDSRKRLAERGRTRRWGRQRKPLRFEGVAPVVLGSQRGEGGENGGDGEG